MVACPVIAPEGDLDHPLLGEQSRPVSLVGILLG